MICKNCGIIKKGDRYALKMPPDSAEAMQEDLKHFFDKYKHCYVKIDKPRQDKTPEENRFFHLLVTEYFVSGCSSKDSWHDLKNDIKMRLGSGFEKYIYIKEDGKQKTYRDYGKIPDIKRAYGVLKSIANYSKDELRILIGNLLSEMSQAGVNSKRFQELWEKFGI